VRASPEAEDCQQVRGGPFTAGHKLLREKADAALEPKDTSMRGEATRRTSDSPILPLARRIAYRPGQSAPTSPRIRGRQRDYSTRPQAVCAHARPIAARSAAARAMAPIRACYRRLWGRCRPSFPSLGGQNLSRNEGDARAGPDSQGAVFKDQAGVMVWA
jgi:hypothetical protein